MSSAQDTVQHTVGAQSIAAVDAVIWDKMGSHQFELNTLGVISGFLEVVKMALLGHREQEAVAIPLPSLWLSAPRDPSPCPAGPGPGPQESPGKVLPGESPRSPIAPTPP